jgi:hypothetical protein
MREIIYVFITSSLASQLCMANVVRSRSVSVGAASRREGQTSCSLAHSRERDAPTTIFFTRQTWFRHCDVSKQSQSLDFS